MPAEPKPSPAAAGSSSLMEQKLLRTGVVYLRSPLKLFGKAHIIEGKITPEGML